jgi:transcriptional regulator with XRE-family HTH domain
MTDEIQSLLRGWIDTITSRKGWTRTRLAREAGVATTTITRLFDDSYTGTMNAASIAKIARASGIPAPRNFGGELTANAAPAEPEAKLVETPADAYGRQLAQSQSVWIAQTSALASLGLMPGDRFVIDSAITPQTRDIILVQAFNDPAPLLRVFADGFAVTPLYLVDGSRRLWIDGSNVAVIGTLIESWRGRTAA